MTGNTAYYGGAAYLCALEGCTVAGNTAWCNGGGTYACGATNSVVWGNSAGVVPTADCAGGALGYSCSGSPAPGEGNIASDPQFANAAAGDYRIPVSSPCADAGCSALATGPLDLAGNPRVRGGAVDMGALESDPSGDMDGDGMPDVWETAHGLNPADASDAAADKDGDGVSNGMEYFRGTDPASAASVNRVLYADSDVGSAAYDGYSATVRSGTRGPKAAVQQAVDAAVSGDAIELRGTSAFGGGVLAPGAKRLTLRPVENVRF
jgi:hypothetical protein